MAGVKRSNIRVNFFSSRFALSRLMIFLLIATGTLQLPIFFDGGTKFVLPHYKKPGPIDPNIFTWEQFFRFIMKPQVIPETDLIKESKDSLEEYQYQQVPKAFTSTFEDKANDDIYNNSLNEIDMDNLSKSKNSNVTILDNSNLQSGKVNDGTFLMKWNNSSSVPESWWSVCQVPVIVVLFGVIGVLAISFIVILWLRKQMQSGKEDNDSPSDSFNDNELMSGNCPSPSQGQAPEDQWMCHTAIDLKGSAEGTTEEAAQAQLPDTVPELMIQGVKEVEKKPEGAKKKPKGLLERRGSSASLTIDLTQNTFDNKLSLVTPPEESTEEFLLSAGRVLNRGQLRNALSNIAALHSEFWEIPLNHPDKHEVTVYGMKNRYDTILPNERTRVKLVSTSENPMDAYINANYIRGYNTEEKIYIATQGPLANTIKDLYHMAWNENSPIIVMITKFYEKSKTKCESYFPMTLGHCVKYGDYEVSVLNTNPKEGYTVRELLVRKNKEVRLIIHYWYDTWPDHRTPDNAYSIITMALEIESLRLSLKDAARIEEFKPYDIAYGPVIVHCSAGIGRTGCFIAICLGMDQLRTENKVDILGIVCQMRYDRGGMIQTAEQYEFVYEALTLYAESLPETSGA